MPARPFLVRTLHGLRSQLRRLGAPRARLARSREVPLFLAQIKSSRAALLDFGQSSDREFSSLAQGLSQLNSRLAALRTQTDSFNTVLQDTDEDRAISSAYALYKNSIDLVHSNAGIAISAQQQLAEVEAALTASCHDRATFDRDYLFQRIVTLGIRIEASRLPSEAQAVFLNVASAIAETGEQIQTCTARAFGRIDEVMAESRAARAELKATEQELHLKARKSIDTIQRELAALQTALAPCAEQSRGVSELLAAAQPQTLKVIAALQHQDIVRQQLEHVGEGFQDLDHHFRATPPPAVEWDYVHHASRIQAAQLDTSRSEIEHAGVAVVDGLHALLATSASLVERFSTMESAAASALDHCHIAEMFAQELHELTRIIDQSQQANVRTGRLVERIEEVVRLFTEEIGHHEFDVKIVALNAQIAAARLSSANALNRLAEETSAMSDSSARVTRKLTADLQFGLGKLDKVKHEGADFLAIVTREKAQLERGLGVVTDKLARLVQRVRSGSEQSRRDFEPVHADCRALLDGLGFPALIESAFAPAARLCHDLVATSAPASTNDAPSASALAKIKQHRSRYTMQKEDATHAAALGAVVTLPVTLSDGDINLFDASDTPSPELIRPTLDAGNQLPATIPVASPVSPPPGDSGFGDGIELF